MGWGFVYMYLCRMEPPLKIQWFLGGDGKGRGNKKTPFRGILTENGQVILLSQA